MTKANSILEKIFTDTMQNSPGNYLFGGGCLVQALHLQKIVRVNAFIFLNTFLVFAHFHFREKNCIIVFATYKDWYWQEFSQTTLAAFL